MARHNGCALRHALLSPLTLQIFVAIMVAKGALGTVWHMIAPYLLTSSQILNTRVCPGQGRAASRYCCQNMWCAQTCCLLLQNISATGTKLEETTNHIGFICSPTDRKLFAPHVEFVYHLMTTRPADFLWTIWWSSLPSLSPSICLCDHLPGLMCLPPTPCLQTTISIFILHITSTVVQE